MTKSLVKFVRISHLQKFNTYIHVGQNILARIRLDLSNIGHFSEQAGSIVRSQGRLAGADSSVIESRISLFSLGRHFRVSVRSENDNVEIFLKYLLKILECSMKSNT